MTYTATNGKTVSPRKGDSHLAFRLWYPASSSASLASTALIPLLHGCSADKCLVKPRLRGNAFVTEALKPYTSKRYKLITDDLEEAVLGTCLSTTFTQRSIIANALSRGVSARRCADNSLKPVCFTHAASSLLAHDQAFSIGFG